MVIICRHLFLVLFETQDVLFFIKKKKNEYKENDIKIMFIHISSLYKNSLPLFTMNLFLIPLDELFLTKCE